MDEAQAKTQLKGNVLDTPLLQGYQRTRVVRIDYIG